MTAKHDVGVFCLCAMMALVSAAPDLGAQDAPPAGANAAPAEQDGGTRPEIQPGAAATAAATDLADMTPAQKADLLTALRRDYHRVRRTIMTKEQQIRRENEEVRAKIDEINAQIKELYAQVQALQKSTAGVYADAEPSLAGEYEKVDKIEETMRQVRDSMRPPTPPRPANAGEDAKPAKPTVPQKRPRGAKP